MPDRVSCCYRILMLRAGLFVASLTACPSLAAQDHDLGAVVLWAIDDYVIPAYRTLSDEAGHFASALNQYCAQTDRENRAALTASFSGLVTAWAGVDFLHFGPVAQEGRYERFAFFPDVHGTGARQLRTLLAREDVTLLQRGGIASESAAVQGLPTLESLLYFGSKALIATDQPDPFRCKLAMAVSDNVKEIAEETVAAWNDIDGWRSLILFPSASNPVYRTHAEAMTEIFDALLTGVEQIQDQRLKPALGNTALDAKPDRAPYSRSGLAIPYMLASVNALERYVEVSRMLDLAPGGQIAISARSRFHNLERLLASAGSDIRLAVASTDKRAKLVEASSDLAELRSLFRNQLAKSAGMTSGFNSLDGD